MRILKKIYKAILNIAFVSIILGFVYVGWTIKNAKWYDVYSVRTNAEIVLFLTIVLIIVLLLSFRIISAVAIAYILYEYLPTLKKVLSRVDLYEKGAGFFYTYQRNEFILTSESHIQSFNNKIFSIIIPLTLLYIAYRMYKSSIKTNRNRANFNRSRSESISYSNSNQYNNDVDDEDYIKPYNKFLKSFYTSVSSELVGKDSQGRNVYKEQSTGKYVTVDDSYSIVNESYYEPYDIYNNSYNDNNYDYYSNSHDDNPYSSSYGFDGYDNYSDYYSDHWDDYYK